MASTLTLREIIDPLRTYPELNVLTTTAGFTAQPALTIANDVMQRILAQSMDWKFNRAYVPPFLTIGLQQDYLTSLTNLSWVESGTKLDINNTASPKPAPPLEAVRDLPPTSASGMPFQVSWIPNSLATLGIWQASTAYTTPYGAATPPSLPITQFKDANGNLLYIDSSTFRWATNQPLGVSSNGGTQTTPSGTGAGGYFNPFGTSGATQPVLAASSAAGTTVTDGTVTWTVADANGAALRLNPVPAAGGRTWLMNVAYQKKPPTMTSLTSTITPIPDEYAYLFRQGFLAMAYEHSVEGYKKAGMAHAKWEQMLAVALQSADRELDESVFYPSDGLMSRGGYGAVSIGPAWPFGPQ